MIWTINAPLLADDQGDTIRVAFNKNLKPFQFMSEDGSPQGMHIDVVRQLIRSRTMKLEFIPCEDDIAALDTLKNGSAELLLGYRTGSAVFGYQSTSEISSTSLCMITSEETRKMIEASGDYGARSAAFEFGTMNHSYLYNLGLKNYFVHGNQEAVAESLLSGKVDFAVGIKETLLSFIEQAGMERQYSILHGSLAPINYSILARSDARDLVQALDLGLAELRAKGEYSKIYNRWVINRDLLEAENARQAAQRLIRSIIVLVLIATVIIGINARANALLKQKVDTKTHELRHANAELKSRMHQLSSESSLRESIIENSPSGMIIYNASYFITFVNSAAIRLSEVMNPKQKAAQSNEILSTDIREVQPFGEIVQIMERNTNLNGDGHSSSIVEIEGAGKTYSYRCSLYRENEFSSIRGYLLMVEDVTREERKKQALFESEKNKILNRLVAGIAHEIKNPLMTIRTAVGLMQSQGEDPEVKEAFTNYVPAEIERINRLIESLIHYARPAVTTAGEFCLSDLLKDCLYLAHLAGKRTHIRFSSHIQENLFLYGNKYQLKQAIINLVMNSIESLEKKHETGAAAESLRMDIRGEEVDEGVRLVIRDTGVGMKPEEIRLCTNPFFTTKASGTGLGLYIANQYVIENRGKMSIESKEQMYTEITINFQRKGSSET
jgi:polar amino acid transport system substrate-binding protein